LDAIRNEQLRRRFPEDFCVRIFAKMPNLRETRGT
jgi:hypothetical protein